MHETIENIIRKNLPEKKEECPEYPCQKCNGLGYTAEHDLPSRHGEDGECVSCPIQVQCEECQATGMIGFLDDKNIGFNQALSQIDTSLIADEVLKVVVEKIREFKCEVPPTPNNLGKIYTEEMVNKVIKYVGRFNYNKALDDLLSNLSTNVGE